MLRIQSGTARGRALKTLRSPHLRPILARVKKSLFDILRPQMAGARFLDIYAGTGAVGLEALSQGAQFATFIEGDRRSGRVLKENVSKLGFNDRAEILYLNVMKGLPKYLQPYSLIFMGPPYKDEEKKPLALVSPTLKAIHQQNLLAKGGLVVAQHQKKEKIGMPASTWSITRQEHYGDTHLTFIKNE